MNRQVTSTETESVIQKLSTSASPDQGLPSGPVVRSVLSLPRPVRELSSHKPHGAAGGYGAQD